MLSACKVPDTVKKNKRMAVFVGVFNLTDYQKQITYKNQILLSLDSIKL